MSIQGKAIVFTGKISKPRQEFQKLVLENGGKFGTSVTKNTDYLVLGENPGSKLAAATQLGTKVISEQEFLDLLRRETFDEVPLTEEKLAELEAHMTVRMCRWCGRTHKQFDTVPDYQTCPVCEILSNPKCPKCNTGDIVFVVMAKNYYCFKCHVFFDAPHSYAVKYIEHIHILDDNYRCVVCRKKWPQSLKVHRTQLQMNRWEQAQETARLRRAQEEEQELRLQRWFQSLTEAEKEELRKQVLAR